MNIKMKQIIILFLYSLPYTFLAMYGDFTYGNLWFYGLMVVTLFGLSLFAVKISGKRLLLLGNLLSFLTSILFVYNSELIENDYYFAPLSSIILVIVISIIMLLLQLGLTKFTRRKESIQ